jgi:hypothetical protein
MDIYMNGIVAASDLGAGVADFSSAMRDVNQLGTTLAHMNYADDSFMGLMDEARLGNAYRSAAWVRLEHENQKPGQSLVFFDSVPVSIAPFARAVPSADFAVESVAGRVHFRLASASPGGARVSISDLTGRVAWSGSFAPGATQLTWNGVDAQGANVSNGVYVARLTLIEQGKVTTAERRVSIAR